MPTTKSNKPTIERVRDELAHLEEKVSAGKKELAEALTSGRWKAGSAVDYYAAALIRDELFADLYREVEAGDATPAAWAATLERAMQSATGMEGNSTDPLTNALRYAKQGAARKWIRDNRLVWAELPQEMLAWAPFNF